MADRIEADAFEKHGPATLCSSCMCMTYTVEDGTCGKCKAPKQRAELLPVTVQSLEVDVSALLLHIDHLNVLMAHLRIGKHPSEAFWKKFDRSKKAEADVRERACIRQGAP